MKSPGQLMEKRQQRQTAMDIDPSGSKIRRQTPFGPAAQQNKWKVEELNQQHGFDEEENYENEEYEFQPIWDEDTEPFPWEPQDEAANFPIPASTNDPPPQPNQNINQNPNP